MIYIDLKDGVFEVQAFLSRNSFSKELLQKMFGMTFEKKSEVYAVKSSKNIDDLLPLIKNYLSVINLLKM